MKGGSAQDRGAAQGTVARERPMSTTVPPAGPDSLPPAEQVKQFPTTPGVYLQIRIREDFPRVEFTRTPRRRGVKLYGPFTSARALRQAMQVLQRIFQFRTCALDIRADDSRWRWFRPCLLHSIRQCTAPCNFRVTKENYRKQIRSLRMVMEGKQERLIREMEAEMQAASTALLFEKAAR